MRKRAKKLLALLTAVTITVTGVNVPAAQAAKVKVTASKTTLYYNGTSAEKKATVTVKNVKGKKVTYSISKAGKKIVKLGDVSGNKTKKFTVTAKKKGTAKVTVKVAGKKVKTIKFTVKKKSTATPKPTVAPTQEPTVAPSDEPTVAPTDAPSDEPTVAPTDAPSDAPTATPSDEPVKDKSVVTEIKILNDVALTDGGTKAYVYYDVLDQYGESMRESCSISWSTSPANPQQNKSLGKLTLTSSNGNFRVGDMIVVTGVHTQTGVSVTKTLNVGLQQQIDTIDFAGYVNENAKQTKLDALGDDFARGTSTYYVLYTAKDQNGNPIDLSSAVEEDNNCTAMTFISDNPQLLDVKSSGVKPFTIGDTTYLGAKVVPGMSADKGGEATVTAISSKTGQKSPIVIKVGDAGVLASLSLVAPENVCDGESVELKYVAKTTKGEETTDYETIVRSTNKLTLNASVGTLTISEKDDGSAKIVWSDKYNVYDPDTYKEADLSDNIARPVSLSTIVVGGTNDFVQFSVQDARIPQAVSLVDKVVTSKNSFTFKDADFTFIDQYGAKLDYKKACAFLTYAGLHKFAGSYYKLTLKSDNLAAVSADEAIAPVITASSVNATITSKPLDEQETTANIKSCIKTSANNSWTDQDSEAVGAIKSSAITVVPLTVINSYKVAVNAGNNVIPLNNNPYRNNEPGAEMGSPFAKGNSGKNSNPVPAFRWAKQVGTWARLCEGNVYGTYKGQDLVINQAYYQITGDSAANVVKTTNDDGVKIIEVQGIKANTVAYADVYDEKSYGDPAKEFSLDFSVQINAKMKDTVSTTSSGSFDYDKSVQKIKTPLTFKYEDQEPAELNFGAVTTPENTNINTIKKDYSNTAKLGYYTWDFEWQASYTVTNIKENTGRLAHANNSFVVIDNGTNSPRIEGAEIGDEYDIVGTMPGGKITKTVHVVVGADTMAKISTKNSDNTDEDFQKKLGYGTNK